MSDLRVLVAAADPLARAGLSALIADQPGCAVVGQSEGGDLAADVELYRPDVIVWDAGWEDSGEQDALRAALESIGEVGPPLAALVSRDSASAIWAAGARGLLRRDVGMEQLAAALDALARGLAVIDPALAGEVNVISPSIHPEQAAHALTPRELEVLQLMAEGLPNKAIALRLGISEHTVKFHVNGLMTRLGAQSRTDAVVRATRLGLIIL